MIKRLSPAQRHLTNRTLAEFHRYWGESHGPLFSNTAALRRYVQHLTIPDAYGEEPAPTFDGISMFWYDDYHSAVAADLDTLRGAVLADDAQLFDRSPDWPMHHKRASVVATEHVVLDGTPRADMVKAIFIVSRSPGLSLSDFFDRWLTVHGPMTAELPGLRRYVQNHGLAVAQSLGGQTHDGWSELWFDDLDSLHRCAASSAWEKLRARAESLFASPLGVGVAQEKVQKDLDWTYNDWGASGASDGEIIERLRADRYLRLAADPLVAPQIRRAAEHKALAVWTSEHLVTIDESHIDARPES